MQTACIQKRIVEQYAHKTIPKLNTIYYPRTFSSKYGFKSDKRFRKTPTVQNATTELAQKEIFIYC